MITGQQASKLLDQSTAQMVLNEAREKYPTLRFALHRNGTWLGLFSDKLGRFQACAGKTLDGRWCAGGYELLVDGKPPYTDADFIE